MKKLASLLTDQRVADLCPPMEINDKLSTVSRVLRGTIKPMFYSLRHTVLKSTFVSIPRQCNYDFRYEHERRKAKNCKLTRSYKKIFILHAIRNCFD